MKERIGKTAQFFMFLFFILILYLSYLQFVKAPSIISHATNPRLLERLSKRGGIYDRRGENLARTLKIKGEFKRAYPLGERISAVVGYDDIIYGESGMEKVLDSHLKYPGLPIDPRLIKRILQGGRWAGCDAYLTIDARIQKIAFDSLGNRRGAVVVMDPADGAILAMATSPSFNPDNLDKDWQKLTGDASSPLMDRAINGLYPPGSTFKLYTLTAALESGKEELSDEFSCGGYLDLGNYRIHEAEGHVHGKVNLTDALVYSCNVAFAQIAMKTGKSDFLKFQKEFFLTEDFGFDLPVTPANFPPEENLTETGLAQSGFGQGEILVTPLHMAMIASAIANKGTLMKPHLVKVVKNSLGDIVMKEEARVLSKPISEGTAGIIKDMMVQAVEMGTGTAVKISGIKVAGKTGTAENPHGATHAWFVAFAPADNPKIVVCVIVENSGYGGAVAAPVARKILLEALK